MTNTIPFDLWIKRLHNLLCHFEYIKPGTKLSLEDWRVFYDEGLKPLDAINADTGNNYTNLNVQWSRAVEGLPKIKSQYIGKCAICFRQF
jgi:hypothetical protein